jgi:hypothetical protein
MNLTSSAFASQLRKQSSQLQNRQMSPNNFLEMPVKEGEESFDNMINNQKTPSNVINSFSR